MHTFPTIPAIMNVSPACGKKVAGELAVILHVPQTVHKVMVFKSASFKILKLFFTDKNV